MRDFHAKAVRIWPFNGTSPHRGCHWDRALEAAYQPPAAHQIASALPVANQHCQALRWQGFSGIRFLAPVAIATRALPLLSQGVSGSLYLAPVAIATRASPLLSQGISGIRYLAPVAIATRALPLLSQGLSVTTILVFCGILSAGSSRDPRFVALV